MRLPSSVRATVLWDISQVLRPGLPVWPGDTPFRIAPTWQIDEAVPVNVSALTLSTHSGAHADAPLHYDPAGADIASVLLDPFIGECLVVDARGCGPRIEPRHVPDGPLPKRVLFRTYDRFPHDVWSENFAAVAPQTIALLAERGVRLIGVDAPSLDPQDSKTMAAHHAVRAADMRILEGLVLDDVPAGRYELIALPLAIAGADAAPVRAILRALS